MTVLFFRNAPPKGTSSELLGVVLSLFWFVGVAVAIHMYNQPCVQLSIENKQINLRLYYPWAVHAQKYHAEELQEALVYEDRDSEGEPYFYARLRFADGREIDIKESAEFALCAESLEQLQQALRA